MLVEYTVKILNHFTHVPARNGELSLITLINSEISRDFFLFLQIISKSNDRIKKIISKQCRG